MWLTYIIYLPQLGLRLRQSHNTVTHIPTNTVTSNSISITWDHISHFRAGHIIRLVTNLSRVDVRSQKLNWHHQWFTTQSHGLNYITILHRVLTSLARWLNLANHFQSLGCWNPTLHLNYICTPVCIFITACKTASQFCIASQEPWQGGRIRAGLRLQRLHNT